LAPAAHCCAWWADPGAPARASAGPAVARVKGNGPGEAPRARLKGKLAVVVGVEFESRQDRSTGPLTSARYRPMDRTCLRVERPRDTRADIATARADVATEWRDFATRGAGVAAREAAEREEGEAMPQLGATLRRMSPRRRKVSRSCGKRANDAATSGQLAANGEAERRVPGRLRRREATSPQRRAVPRAVRRCRDRTRRHRGA
jgi:hypothetical protein